jgi:hypothetical protein
MTKTIHCEIFVREGKSKRNVVAVKREMPREFTEAQAARWMLERASEMIPCDKTKRAGHD